jgi:hypothetical protein
MTHRTVGMSDLPSGHWAWLSHAVCVAMVTERRPTARATPGETEAKRADVTL